jgi:hypothetical protein
MIQTQKMLRKQAVRRRMHPGIADSSKNCAGRDFKRDRSAGWKDQGGTHKSSVMATQRPICAGSGPNYASQRNDAKCHKRTYDLCYVIMTTKVGAWRKPAMLMFYTEKQIAETIAALECYSPGQFGRK